MDQKTYWTTAYTNKKPHELSWYEHKPEPLFQLIRSLKLSPYAELLSVGNGISPLIELLLEDGFQNITVNDISSAAFDMLRAELGKEECNVEWVLDDLTAPKELYTIPAIDLWIDRAVLHFFTSNTDRLAYFNLLKQKVKPGGYVIIATFSKDGKDSFAGLPVVQYDPEMLEEQLGFDFELKQAFHHTFTNPDGEEQPFLYTLFQRKQA